MRPFVLTRHAAQNAGFAKEASLTDDLVDDVEVGALIEALESGARSAQPLHPRGAATHGTQWCLWHCASSRPQAALPHSGAIAQPHCTQL